MSKLLWKVCGMREDANIKKVLELSPDFMGFIFFQKSPRDASDLLSESLIKGIPASTKKIGVFVNEDLDEILKISERYELDGVQMHGDETPEFCLQLKSNGLLVLKAFSIGEEFDFTQLGSYLDSVDIFLFDTKAKGAYGGHGITFNWDILKSYSYKKPFLLAGGISLENIENLKFLKSSALLGIDVNSKFEVKPGLKNLEKLKSLKRFLN